MNASVVAGTAAVSRAVEFDVPAGACDCHVHVFEPIRFPFSADRVYTPAQATLADLRAVQQSLHMERVVIVAPSVYGRDNTCTLDAVRRIGGAARAVVELDDSFSRGELQELEARGARGLRVNFETTEKTDVDEGRRALDCIAENLPSSAWHVQFDTRLTVIRALRDQIAQLPYPIVFSHFGRAQAALGTEQPGFEDLLWLVTSGKAYVKISAPYRISVRAPDFPDVEPIARKLISANVDRIIWGSNWPHPGRAATRAEVAAPYPNADCHVLNLLARWAPDSAIRKKILVDNAAVLYGFQSEVGV